MAENGRIKSLGKGTFPPGDDILKINARNNYVSPGFIDLHVHGRIDKLSAELPKQGTTGFLWTLHTNPVSSLGRKIAAAKRTPLNGAACLGFNIEGPFINREMAGAQPRRFIIEPSGKVLEQLLKNHAKDIRIMTVACELKGSGPLIKKLKKAGIVVSLGHSKATIEQAKKAVDLGADYATHMFNRMGPVTSREPGLVTAVLLDERITAEVIADKHHVHPDLLRLLVKNKKPHNLVLITDSVAAMDKTSLKIIKGVYRMENHTIAGSNLTMIEAVKNMVNCCGLDLSQVIDMASFNPARVVGLKKKKGRLEKGYDADIIIFDEHFQVKAAVLSGKIKFNRIAS